MYGKHSHSQLYMLTVNGFARGMFPSGQFQLCYPLMERKRYNMDKGNIVKSLIFREQRGRKLELHF